MKKTLIPLLVLAIIGGAYALYSYNKGPRDLNAEKSEMSITADELLSEFALDEQSANEKYLDKIMEVEGIVSDVTLDEVTTILLETGDIMSSIACEMASGMKMDNVEAGSKIRIKGQCTGFLSDVILVKCVIIN